MSQKLKKGKATLFRLDLHWEPDRGEEERGSLRSVLQVMMKWNSRWIIGEFIKHFILGQMEGCEKKYAGVKQFIKLYTNISSILWHTSFWKQVFYYGNEQWQIYNIALLTNSDCIWSVYKEKSEIGFYLGIEASSLQSWMLE